MKRSNWILVFVIFILLIVVYINNKDESKTESETIKTSFVGLDTALIDQFVLKTRDGESMKLVKDAGTWKIAEPIRYPVNSTFIASILKQVAGFTIESKVSRGGSPELDKKFEVDSSNGFPVEIYSDGKLLSAFLIGKIADSYRHTYVKEKSKDPIYLLKENITYTFKKNLKDWRDKSILDLDKDLIEKVEVFRGNEDPMLFEKKDSSWSVKKGEAVKNAKMGLVNSLLANVSRLQCDGFLDEENEALSNSPVLTVKILLTNGKEFTLEGFASEENESSYYTRLSGNGQVFTVSKSKFSQFEKEFKDFVETEKTEK